MARPSSYREEFHPQDFIEQSRKGRTLTQIAASWDISRETVYQWGKSFTEFSDALKRGRELSEAWYIDLGQSAITGNPCAGGEKFAKFNLGAYVWLTKNLFKWADQIEEKIPEGVESVHIVRKTKWGSAVEQDPDKG